MVGGLFDLSGLVDNSSGYTVKFFLSLFLIQHIDDFSGVCTLTVQKAQKIYLEECLFLFQWS